MFKSVFAKYITAATAIVLLTFFVLSSVITSIIEGENLSRRKDDLARIASRSADIVGYGYALGEYGGLSDYLRENQDIEYAVSSLTEDYDAVAFFILDMNGSLLLSASGFEAVAAELLAESAFFSEVKNELLLDGEYLRMKQLTSFGKDEQIVAAHLIQGSGGESLGAMLCFTSDMGTESIVGATSRAIILACLWIMIAMLIAVYFLTERIVGPLKRMSVASEGYAKGKFDQRIEVSGRDEVAQLALAFNNMADELDMLEQKRNQFLSDVSHELRSPMMSILGFVEGIKSGAIPKEKEAYYLDLTASEIKRLSRLVSDLLDVSRLEMGEKKLNFVKCNLPETVFTVMVSLEKRIEEKRLEVTYDEENASLPILADADALHRMLYNLIENAIKFSYDGGALKVSLYEGRAKEAVFEIYNEGSGIPEADIPNIFDRFYKSDKSRSLDKKGVGLGLYFVKTILKAHGGSIRCESEEGKYCRFTVTLPPYKEK